MFGRRAVTVREADDSAAEAWSTNGAIKATGLLAEDNYVVGDAHEARGGGDNQASPQQTVSFRKRRV